MTNEELQELIIKDKYQVFLLCSKVPLPLPMGVHCWFVVNLKGDVHRWEFGQFVNSPHRFGIGILKDFFQNTTGMNKYAWKQRPRWPSTLLGVVEGGDGTVAQELASFIEAESESYPLRKIYVLLGPNSNTYISWVLSKFPEAGLKLPANAIGKGFPVKRI